MSWLTVSSAADSFNRTNAANHHCRQLTRCLLKRAVWRSRWSEVAGKGTVVYETDQQYINNVATSEPPVAQTV